MSGAAGSSRNRNENNSDDWSSESSWRLSDSSNDGIILQNYYPLITPARHPISRSPEEEDYAKAKAAALTSIIPAERLFLGVPTLPSLVAFQAIDNVPRATQFYFNGDETTPALIRHQRFSADHALTPSEYFDGYHRALQPAWESVGSIVVTTGWDFVPAGSVGRLENQYSWRWDRTRARPDLPRPYGVLRRGNPLGAVAFTVVGNRVVKLRVQSESATGGVEPLIHGCFYDAEFNDWKYLMPLRGPVRDGRFVWLLHAFQRNDRLVVVVRSGETDDALAERVHASDYDFQARCWSEWNGTPELVMIARAVTDLYQIDRFLYSGQPPHMMQIVGAWDGTLFAVTHANRVSGRGEVVLWYLYECDVQCRAYWVRVMVPPLVDTQSYSNPMVWPLMWFGGIAVVCRNRGELAWWLVRKSGVYHRGSFALTTSVEENMHNRYCLVYTHI